MANISEGGSGKVGKIVSPEILAAAFASDIDKMTRRFVGTFYATVTNTDFIGSGWVYAELMGTTIRVVCDAGAGISVGSEIRVRRLAADANTSWEYVGGGGGGGGGEYGLCFGDPGSNTVGSVYVSSGGSITSIQTDGTGSVALAVGGVSVGVGDAVSSGSWLTATLSGASGDYFSVAVMIS